MIIVIAQKDHDVVTELREKGQQCSLKMSFPLLWSKYICVIHDASGIINTAIVIAAGLGMTKKVNLGLFECNGGHIGLRKVELSIC